VPTPHAELIVDESVAILTFNRPEARNAMTWEMYEALNAACERASTDESIRALVLRGAGGAFVSGTDIGQFTRFQTRDDAIGYERRLDAVIERLEEVPIPTVAQVNGAATGGGCVIALACDLRVCTPAARFGIPIARTLGNCLSAANTARLIDLIGPARAKELLITGRLLDALEAQALGLVTRMADLADIDAVVRDLVAAISTHAPLTIRATKQMILRTQRTRRIPQEAGDDLVVECYTSGDFKEGVAAFLEKRPPRFTGR
jgi:enoyl-CoA hydratase